MSFGRRDIRGGAVQTTLNGGISSGAASGVITATTGWPDGGAGAFYIVVDPGLTTEEKILCSTRSSTTVNFTTRGADGTSAAAHASGAAVYPCVTAVDLDEANLAVSKLIGLATTIGQVPYVDAANSFAMIQAKTSGSIIVGNGTIPAVVAVSGDATLASSGALTVANSAITTAKLNANAVTNAILAGMTRGTVKIGNASGVASDLAVGTAGQYLKADGTDVAWALPPALGRIGSAKAVANQSLSATTSFADLTSLTVTFTAVAARIYKISFCLPAITSDAGTFQAAVVKGAATFLTGLSFTPSSVSQFFPMTGFVEDTPGAGSVTYKLQGRVSTGTANVVLSGNSTAPMVILIEDVGT